MTTKQLQKQIDRIESAVSQRDARNPNTRAKALARYNDALTLLCAGIGTLVQANEKFKSQLDNANETIRLLNIELKSYMQDARRRGK